MIKKVGKQRKEYPDHTKIDFMSLEEYLKIARRIIGHFANNIYPGLANRMLKNEDAVSHVAYCLMLGTWEWKPDGGRTYRSYLNQRGYWAIQDYLNNEKNKNQIKSIYTTITNNGKEKMLIDLIEDSKSKQPINELINNETLENITNFKGMNLTKSQEKYFSKYIDGMSLSEIAKESNVSRQNVEQSIQKAIKKCRETVGTS